MLSVDLKVLKNAYFLVCRGDVIGGKQADYLFDLITRDGTGDVILDFAAVNQVDAEGLSVLTTAYALLAHMGRRLILKSASVDLVRTLQARQMEAILDMEERSRAQASSSIQ